MAESEEDRKKREAYRSNIVKEIVASEERYVEGLRTLVDFYCNPLQQAIKDGQPVITQAVYDSIFQNINLICSFNEQLLRGLKNMDDNDQVGLIFNQFAPFLKMYTAYTDNSEEAMQRVREQLNKDSPALLNLMANDKNLSKLGIRKSFKDWCATGGRENKERLESLLIQPVQRVPRYRMLLAELLKYTKNDNKDYARIKGALDTVSIAATHCNEGLRARAREQERAELHQRFPKQLKWSSKSLKERKIVLEEVMLKIDRKGTTRPNVVILFNDLLAYGKGTKGGEVDFSHVLELKGMSVANREQFTDPKGVLYKFCFQVNSRKKSFALAAESEAMRSEWVQAIRKAIGGDRPMAKTAPIWEPDRKDCRLCGVKFNIFGKKPHHCRNCGTCVCANCSPFNMKLKFGLETKPQRVCTRCYPKLCFTDRVERFYNKWDATKLEQQGWLDGIVDENYERKAEFMQDLVARFGPEPEVAGTVMSREQAGRSMSVSQGSSSENVEALQLMAKNLESEKDVLLEIGLKKVTPPPSPKKSAGADGDDFDAAAADDALAQTVPVENVEDTFGWDERLWAFFKLYDSAELQKHPNLVAKILMQCPTESSRRRMMQGLEQKYGPENDAKKKFLESLSAPAEQDYAPVAAAADSETESDSDAEELEAHIWG